MISVGIDVSKGKSTVCILKPYGEIVSKPFNITHTHKDLSELSSMLFRSSPVIFHLQSASEDMRMPPDHMPSSHIQNPCMHLIPRTDIPGSLS